MWKEGIICIAIVGSILFGNVITQNYTQESIGEFCKDKKRSVSGPDGYEYDRIFLIDN